MNSAYKISGVSSRRLHASLATLLLFVVTTLCGCDGGRGKATDAALASAEELITMLNIGSISVKTE